VGGAMNTTVVLMQSEQVGMTKQVTVKNKFSVDVGDEFVVSVGGGAASFVMKSDGSVVIDATTIEMTASTAAKLNGKDVDIN
jgi:type VI secretion system secreted protein VgrG